MSLRLPGEIAYEIYGKSVDFKNFKGDPMPSFRDLPENIQKAWGDVERGLKSYFLEHAVIQFRNLIHSRS